MSARRHSSETQIADTCTFGNMQNRVIARVLFIVVCVALAASANAATLLCREDRPRADRARRRLGSAVRRTAAGAADRNQIAHAYEFRQGAGPDDQDRTPLRPHRTPARRLAGPHRNDRARRPLSDRCRKTRPIAHSASASSSAASPVARRRPNPAKPKPDPVSPPIATSGDARRQREASLNEYRTRATCSSSTMTLSSASWRRRTSNNKASTSRPSPMVRRWTRRWRRGRST